MKKQIAMYVLWGAVICVGDTTAYALSIGMPAPAATANQAEDISTAPQLVRDVLRSATYVDDFTTSALREFRQYAGEKQTLTKADIDLVKNKETAGIRAIKVREILQADLDGDGKITEQEFKQFFEFRNVRRSSNQDYTTLWTTYDINADKVVTYDELLKAANASITASANNYSPTNRLESLFAYDTNKDGTLTVDELKDHLQKLFAIYDTDKNGILSREEKMAFNTINTINRSGMMNNPQSVSPMPITKDAELHVVGVYEGDTGSNGQVHGPVVPISLNRPGKKVALILTSYEPVRWNITLGKDTQLTEAYWGATAQSTTPSEVLINGKQFAAAKKVPLHFAYESKGAEFRQMLSTISIATGRDHLDSFNGKYRPDVYGFSIADVSVNQEFKKNRLVVEPADKLPSLTFYARLRGVSGVYNLSGVQTAPLQATLVKSAYVPDRKEFYTIQNAGLKRFDAGGKELEVIPLSLDVPRLSWATDITYNPKTNAVVVSSLGGEGYLYSYTLDSKKWTAVSLNNHDYPSFQYDAASGNYLATEGMGITEVGTNGKPVRRIPLSADQLPGATDVMDTNNGRGVIGALPIQDYIIVMISGSGMGQSFDRSASRIYLYDRKTAVAKLTYVSPDSVQ